MHPHSKIHHLVYHCKLHASFGAVQGQARGCVTWPASEQQEDLNTYSPAFCTS